MAEEENKKENAEDPGERKKLWPVVVLICCFLLFLMVCPLLSYSPDEAEWLAGGLPENVLYHKNLLGGVGAGIGYFLLLTFGIAVYPTLLFVALSAWLRLTERELGRITQEYYWGFLLLLCSSSCLFGCWPGFCLGFCRSLNFANMPGGVLGRWLTTAPHGLLCHIMGETLIAVLCAALLFGALLILGYFDWRYVLCRWYRQWKERSRAGAAKADAGEVRVERPPVRGTSLTFGQDSPLETAVPAAVPAENVPEAESGMRAKRIGKEERAKLVQEEIPFAAPVSGGPKPLPGECNENNYQLPPVSLLDSSKDDLPFGMSAEKIEQKAEALQKVLDEYGCSAKVVGAISGAQITCFRILPSPGLRLNRISSLYNELQMALCADNLRILTPIPGENYVGVEVPNEKPSLISLHSLVVDSVWQNTKARIPLLMGRAIDGKAHLLDLQDAPHLLVAGVTGGGKSVCLNLMMASMLLKFRPDELRMIIVDPKVVEFQTYAKLPHLITPIINDPQKVPVVLNWAITEMNRRYAIMAKVGPRKITEYNARTIRPDEPLDDDGNPLPAKMPYIVIIIDEVGDIMISSKSKKEVEDRISALAGKARAVGIHLILATQRPEVKVISGTIKANFPTRIALKTTTATDSMTILGCGGAENLIGHGDMLFMKSLPLVRLQCGMATDADLEKLANYASEQAGQQFAFDVATLVDSSNSDDALDGEIYGPAVGPDGNPIAPAGNEEHQQLVQAIDYLISTNRASASILQRRFRWGYNKAANVIEKLEEMGVVSPQGTNGQRELLVHSRSEVSGVQFSEEPADAEG